MKHRSQTTLLVLGLVAWAGFGGASCRTTRESSPAHADDARIVVGQPAGAWTLTSSRGEAGRLVRYESPAVGSPSGLEGSRVLFAVQNTWGQDLGLVDGLGRAWRYRPWSEEPEWVGTGTVIEGARRVLGLEEPLSAVPEHAVEAPESPSPQSWAAGRELISIPATPDPMNSLLQPPQESSDDHPGVGAELRDSGPH